MRLESLDPDSEQRRVEAGEAIRPEFPSPDPKRARTEPGEATAEFSSATGTSTLYPVINFFSLN